MPLRERIEASLLARAGLLPGREPTRHGLDTLTGNDLRLDFVDTLGRPDDQPVAGSTLSLHEQLEASGRW